MSRNCAWSGRTVCAPAGTARHAASATPRDLRIAFPFLVEPSASFLLGVGLYHLGEEIAAFIDRANADALVQSMRKAAVGIAEHAGKPVGGNPRRVQEGAIG